MVAIEQTVSCCSTAVEITAVDVHGNIATCKTDQCTIGLNLNLLIDLSYLLISSIFFKGPSHLYPGDIVAITLGFIITILLITFIAIGIIKRRSNSISDVIVSFQ